jgi:hypothetical protein
VGTDPTASRQDERAYADPDFCSCAHYRSDEVFAAAPRADADQSAPGKLQVEYTPRREFVQSN